MGYCVNNNNKKGLETQLPRVLGLMAGVSVVTGSMLGVGIFLFPPLIAYQSGSIGLFFLLWIIGGVYALSGSVACGELGAMIPKSGGDYVFQQKAFGPSMAFATGWVLFVAIFGGSIAGMSVALFQYQVPSLFGIDTASFIYPNIHVSISHLLAVILILFLTLLNHLGIRFSTLFQIVLTLVPIVLLLYIAFNSFDLSQIQHNKPFFEYTSFRSVVTGFLFVNFAYSGWLNIIYVAGEVKHPGRNIPRSMFISIIGISLLYCLLCAVFIMALGFNGLASLENEDAGTATAIRSDNGIIRMLVLLSITMAIIASLNATILASARVAYAMACEGAFWKGASRLGGKSRTPRNALWVQAILASLLVLSGSFSAIIEMTSIAMLVTGSLTVASLFVLRKKDPGVFRPYKAFGFPWFPGFYLVMSFVVLTGVIIESFNSDGFQRFYPLIGITVLLLAFVVHHLCKTKAEP